MWSRWWCGGGGQGCGVVVTSGCGHQEGPVRSL